MKKPVPSQKSKGRRTWTPEEIRFVEENTGSMTASLMAEHLGRTEDGVRWMIRHLDNPTPEHERPWTEAEKKVLHTWFLRPGSLEQVMSILPWRTRSSIIRMMDRLTTPEPGRGHSRQWSAEELRILEQYYPVEGIAVANRLPGRTFCAVRSTANLRGLKSGLHQRKWTQEEWRLVEENKYLPAKELAALFPGRTQKAVYKAQESVKKKARIRRVQARMPQQASSADALSNLSPAECTKTLENNDNKSLAWTSRDLAFLETHYGVMEMSELAEKLGRTVVAVRITGNRLKREKNGDDRAKVAEKHRRDWTLQELQFVEAHYGVMKTAEIARTLGRSVVSVRQAARNQGRNKTCRAWTEAEEDIIRMEYALGSRIKKIMERLPGRTREAIIQRARKMEIVNARSLVWSEQERQILKQHYPTEGTGVTAMLPGRTARAVNMAAHNMGITFQGSAGTSRHQKWREQEWQLLGKNSHLPLKELTALFPGRTQASVQHALMRLKNGQTVTEEE
ncbi:hypothetical protein CB172_20365 [Salmonella enterica subsp. enterica serovar Claibornei]|nr:hypothetical protein [Salmonella enterica subsp. enterica serovar Claibornei]